MKNWFFISGLMLLAAVLTASAADVMKAFPAAENGMVRYVLHLPKQNDESVSMVELIVGKTVQLDTGNKYFFGGKIEAENISGWGYTRFLVPKLGPMAGTMMAIDPNAPKVDRFVGLGGQPFLIPYNSRMPVVVYVPEGVEVRYRIWSAESEAKVMIPSASRCELQ